MYCNPPWSLALHCVEHIRTCHARSPLNTKALIVLPNWPQFNAATTGLRLLRQVPIDTPVSLGKRHTAVKILWPINYWVIDKDTSVKASPPLVKSVDLLLTMDEPNNKSNINNIMVTYIMVIMVTYSCCVNHYGP